MKNLLRNFRNIIRKPVFKRNDQINNKVVIITGGNSGIGLETAVDLAKRNGKIYIACRDLKRSQNALEEIKERSKSSKVHLMELDLASLKSIRNFTKKFQETENRLDILINNAGVMACPKSYTDDGFEMQIGVNHLGHFLLTNLLLDMLKASAPSRIVVVSSEGHRITDINRDDLMSEKSYSKIKAYGQSKLANILFARELSKRLHDKGVSVNSCHPGLVHTNLGRHMKNFSWIRPVYRAIFKLFYKTPFEGAQTQIRLAVDPDLQGITGKYFSDCEEVTPSNAARNDETAAWLWRESTQLIYDKFQAFEK